MSNDLQPPVGFELFSFSGPFNQVLGDVYHKEINGQTVCGFYVTEQQTNSLGICHGGALMTFADIALACAMASKMDKYAGLPTMNLNVDFLAAAEQGMWLQSSVDQLEMAYTSGFITASIKCEDKIILHANGRYKIPKAARV
jgi:uncharacterized protein (TIGR00369 family)